MNDADTQQLADAQTRHRRRRVQLMTALLLAFVTAAGLYGAYWYLAARHRVVTDDAYVQGNQVALMTQTPGIVTSITVDDTDAVVEGQTLVMLDQTDARTALDQAEARLAAAVRHVHMLRQQEAQQQAVVAERQVMLDQSHADYLRSQNLRAAKTISEQELQHSQTAWQSARQQLVQAERLSQALQVELGDTDIRGHPEVVQAVADLRAAWLAFRRTTIVAPMDGYVANRHVQIGEQIAPGAPLLAVVPLEQVWVEANFKETELGHVRIGQPVTITSDFYGSDVTYHGRVEGISPGTGSVFSLLPAQNATGNWIKVVQRLPVRVSLDAAELRGNPLRLGLSMRATVDVRDTSGEALAPHAARGPLYQTDVYSRQLDGLQETIDRIIEANGANGGPHLTGTGESATEGAGAGQAPSAQAGDGD